MSNGWVDGDPTADVVYVGPWRTTRSVWSAPPQVYRFTWTTSGHDPAVCAADVFETLDARVLRLALENKRQEEYLAARHRARELLVASLDAGQRADFVEGRSFKLRVPSGRRYMIALARYANVHEIDERGRPVVRYCLHPVEMVPDEDTVVAQKLWLEACEDEFIRVAHATRRWTYKDEAA